jgi:hypothetical protein
MSDDVRHHAVLAHRTTNERSISMTRTILTALVATVVLAAIGAAAALAGGDGGDAGPSALGKVRAATAKYHDVAVALADGYVPASPCTESPAGTMGVHYLNPALAADDVIDPLRPELLLYLPGGDGKQRLVAVEYFKADADQDLSTDDDRPRTLGRAFDGPMEGHGPGMPGHFDLHVWVWAHNPNGMFAEWNPSVSC